MDYKVIVVNEEYESDAARKLEENVKKHIHDGWKPLGGMSVSRSTAYTRFQKYVMAQAMIKE